MAVCRSLDPTGSQLPMLISDISTGFEQVELPVLFFLTVRATVSLEAGDYLELCGSSVVTQAYEF
jgi:hypothetical protein